MLAFRVQKEKKEKNPQVCSTSDASTSQAGRFFFFNVTVVFSGWRFGLQRLDYLNHSGVGSFLEWIVLGWILLGMITLPETNRAPEN